MTSPASTASSGKACSTALSSSSLSTMTSGVAISAGRTPQLPSRRMRTVSPSQPPPPPRPTGHPAPAAQPPRPLGGRRRDAVHDPVELDLLVGRHRQRLVDERDGRHPPDGLLQGRL